MNRIVLKKFFSYPLGLLIIAVAFFVVTQLISLFYASDIGNRIELNKLQKKIEDISMQMDEFAKNHNNTASNYNFFEDKYIKSVEKLGLTTFTYFHDSLIAWSSNVYILKQELDTLHTNIINTDNAVVLVKDYHLKQFDLRLCYPLSSNYKIQNEYLKNQLNPKLEITKDAHINKVDGKGELIYDSTNKPIARVEWTETNEPTAPLTSIIFLFYIAGILALISSVLKFVEVYLKNTKLKIAGKLIGLTILFGFVKISTWPALLFSSDVFDPVIFANSSFIDSLGSLFILSLFSFFAIAILLDIFRNKGEESSQAKFRNYLEYGLFLIVLFLSILVFKNIISALIFNSTISFDLTQATEISHLSIIGLSSIGIWIFGIYLFYARLYSYFYKINLPSKVRIITELSLIIVASIWVYFNENNYYAFAFFIFLIIVQKLIHRKGNYPKATLTTLFLLGISMLISFWLNSLNTKDERNKRKSILQTVAIDQDPQAEYLFSKISKDIYKDKFLLSKIENNAIEFDSISSYITNMYFRKYQHFNKYDFQITTCTSDLHLLIQPQNIEIQCDSFFYYNLIKYGTLTDNKNLYFLQYGTGQTNYLGLFRFYEMSPDGYIPYTVYVEINSKLKRKGFTKLLSEKAYDPFEKIEKYSLATYIDGKRVETYGDYNYPEHFSWKLTKNNNFEFIEKNSYDHLVFQQDSNKTFVLSLKEPSYLNKLSPFSYLFIFFGLIFIMLGFTSGNVLIKINLKPNFSSRLQVTMISIIIISFTIISIITIIYIQKLNEDKNKLQLENLAVALQTEFEHKLGDTKDLYSINKDYLEELLLKFSKVFDTDINIYSKNGHLLATTRPEIFDYPLLAKLMNPSAVNYLKVEHQGLFIAKENIGGLLYSSAYLPTHNNLGENIGYLNLPYFAREEFLKKEISSLLMTLMNVYTLIIVLSILVILVVSNYITRPLSMLKQRLQEVSLDKEIQKIEWHGIEEIKTLVDEYNQMVEKLALSSEKLAKSERESAWREMAKQVAHEIKNPLTPMKLSIQYLLHSYNENDENNKDRIRSLSNTLIEQIDTLSDIATAFSDFAKMPNYNQERHDLRSVIKSVIDLFTDQESVKIEFNCEQEQLVNIDKNQWIRVFNNLIKNSIQATEEGKKTEIKINLHRTDTQLKITFSDNGKGIPEEMKDKIFSPNFTTKTKGTGLGLAMVKNIVNNSGGEIHFASTPNIGADFYISIPLNPTEV
jgi:signal transduction histidine kinase